MAAPPSQQELIVKLLRDFGVDYEPKVVTMLLELQYALVKQILRRAKEAAFTNAKELQEKDLKVAFAELPNLMAPFATKATAGDHAAAALINGKALPLPSQTPHATAR